MSYDYNYTIESGTSWNTAFDKIFVLEWMYEFVWLTSEKQENIPKMILLYLAIASFLRGDFLKSNNLVIHCLVPFKYSLSWNLNNELLSSSVCLSKMAIVLLCLRRESD